MSSRVVPSHLMGFRSISIVYQNRYKCLSREGRHAPPIAPRPCRAVSGHAPAITMSASKRRLPTDSRGRFGCRTPTLSSVRGPAEPRNARRGDHRDQRAGDIMGNRGILHDESRQIVRTSRNMMWLVCRLEFNGRRRELMGLFRLGNLATENNELRRACRHAYGTSAGDASRLDRYPTKSLPN
jgi:hypothetical protein